MRFVDLWRWDCRVDRKTYALVGFTSFFVKYWLDWLITGYFLPGSSRFFYNYWTPLGSPLDISKLSSYQMEYLAAMLLAAMPFILLGLAMTTRRLRDSGWPVWLCVFFFVPVVNVIFLLALCVLPPARHAVASEAAPWPGPRALDGIIPRSQAGSAALATVLAAVIGLVFLLFGTVGLRTYGWGLFIALPVCLGLFAVLLHSYHGPRGFGESMGVALLPLVIVGAVLLLVAFEGLICILMAAPLAAGLAALGGMLGYTIQSAHWMSRQSGSMLSIVLLILPAAFGVERAVKAEPPRFEVRTVIDVNAAPEKVWEQVVAFSEIAPPREMLFRAGVAYPIRAEMSGRGPGAVRRCIFSTGVFVEPIEVWDEPKLLRFGVAENPPPLNELSPYGRIETRHLKGYFLSEQGQFLLTALPDGRTRLEGTTWYRNAIWPAGYWKLWSDYIIHRIHLRVLEHIRSEVEGAELVR